MIVRLQLSTVLR